MSKVVLESENITLIEIVRKFKVCYRKMNIIRLIFLYESLLILKIFSGSSGLDNMSRKGSKYDPNDPSLSGYDPNDPHGRKGSGGTGYDPNDPSLRKGSKGGSRGGSGDYGDDANDPYGRKGSDSLGPNSRKGSKEGLRKGSSRGGSGDFGDDDVFGQGKYDPNDPNSQKGSRADPNNPNNRKGSGFDPNDPNR